MTASVRVVLNRNLDREFAASEGARQLLEPLGDPLEAGAKGNAPRDFGDLIDSIHYDVGRDDDGLYRGRLNADDFKAAFHEFGTINNPASAFLRSTVEDVVGPVTGGVLDL